MAKAGYIGISIKRAVYDPIDRLLRDHPEFGYTSPTDFFVKSAVAGFARLKEAVAREPAPEPESEPYEHPSSRTKRLRREAALAPPSPPASVEGPATPTSRPGRRRTPRGRVAEEGRFSSPPPPEARAADVVPAPTREASLSTAVEAEGDTGSGPNPGLTNGDVRDSPTDAEAATRTSDGQPDAIAAAKPASTAKPRPAPPKGLDLRRVEAYVRQFTGSAKDHYPGDAQGQRLFLQGCVKRAAEMQLVFDLDDAAAGAILEDLKVEVK